MCTKFCNRSSKTFRKVCFNDFVSFNRMYFIEKSFMAQGISAQKLSKYFYFHFIDKNVFFFSHPVEFRIGSKQKHNSRRLIQRAAICCTWIRALLLHPDGLIQAEFFANFWWVYERSYIHVYAHLNKCRIIPPITHWRRFHEVHIISYLNRINNIPCSSALLSLFN